MAHMYRTVSHDKVSNWIHSTGHSDDVMIENLLDENGVVMITVTTSDGDNIEFCRIPKES